MDRNFDAVQIIVVVVQSLSARRAWIEILQRQFAEILQVCPSLSARRAWIEIIHKLQKSKKDRVALRKESVDRNFDAMQIIVVVVRRSPQGERG